MKYYSRIFLPLGMCIVLKEHNINIIHAKNILKPLKLQIIESHMQNNSAIEIKF